MEDKLRMADLAELNAPGLLAELLGYERKTGWPPGRLEPAMSGFRDRAVVRFTSKQQPRVDRPAPANVANVRAFVPASRAPLSFRSQIRRHSAGVICQANG